MGYVNVKTLDISGRAGTVWDRITHTHIVMWGIPYRRGVKPTETRLELAIDPVKDLGPVN